MPPPEPNDPIWYRSDQFPELPRGNLAPERLEAFLDAIFANLVKRPKSVKLTEGARVARYLKATALCSAPGPVRESLERLAASVERMVLQAVPIPMASKQQALRFLERYAGTYFCHPHFESELELVRQAEAPSEIEKFFVLPKLVSKQMAIPGPGVPRIADDLSERIYAAYHALRRADCHGARTLVAGALNRNGIRIRSRSEISQKWGGDEVWERVKQYESRLRRDVHGAGREAQAQRIGQARDSLVDKWIFLMDYFPQSGSSIVGQ